LVRSWFLAEATKEAKVAKGFAIENWVGEVSNRYPPGRIILQILQFLELDVHPTTLEFRL